MQKVRFLLVMTVSSQILRPAICKACQEIQCKSECLKDSTKAFLGEGLILTCSALHNLTVPQATKRQKTAVPPESLAVQWHRHAGESSGQYSLNISWIQEVKHLRWKWVKGYYLDVDATSYRIKLHIKKAQSMNGSTSRYIRFHFNCYGTENQVLKLPKKGEYGPFLTLNALPMQKKKLSRNAVYIISSSVNTQTQTTLSRYTELSARIGGYSDSVKYYWACGGLIAILFLVLGCVVLAIRLRKKGQNTVSEELVRKTKSILMIANVMNQDLTKKALQLVFELRKHSDLAITCNWEDREKFVNNSLQWYCTNMQKAEIIVFVSSKNEPTDPNASDEFTSAKNFYIKHWRCADTKAISLVIDTDEEKSAKSFEIHRWDGNSAENEEFFRNFLDLCSAEDHVQETRKNDNRKYFVDCSA